MIGNPNPNPNPNPSSAMIPQYHTLILTLILSFLFSSAAAASSSSSSSSSRSPPTSPSPSPSPAKVIMSDPIGFLRHAPPLKEIFPRPPPPPPPCPSHRIDCLERGRSHGHARVGPQPAKSEIEKLNFGKKIGLVFAAAAILLQVVFVGFLVYKRIQLKKLDRIGDRLVSASGSS